jgi:hypothetical protein
MTDGLVTLQEAARLAHVTRGTIQYWLRTGRLAVAHIPERSEWSQRVRPGAKKPYRMQVRRADVLACSYSQRIRQLKSENAQLNLLTVREVAALCGRNQQWVYHLAKKFEVKKYYIDAWTYMVSGAELWEKSQDDPYYAQLFLDL